MSGRRWIAGVLLALSTPAAADQASDRARAVRGSEAAQRGDCTTALKDFAPLLKPERIATLGPMAAGVLTVASLCEVRERRAEIAYALAVRATKSADAPAQAWKLRLAHEMQEGRTAAAVATIEALANGNGAILNGIDVRWLWQVGTAARNGGDPELEQRFLKALAESYAPDPLDGDADPFRLRYAKLLLARGDRAGALATLRGVALPPVLRTMMLDRDLRPALPPGFDLKVATELRLEVDRGVTRAHPDRLSPILEVATGLRELGRPHEALAVLEGAREAVGQGSFADIEDYRSWWWDAMFRTSMMLGDREAAIAYLRTGIKLPENGGANTSQVLNLAMVLDEAGRPRDALALLSGGQPLGGTSPYGEMQLRLARGCAHAQLGQKAEAAAERTYMEAHATDAPAALHQLLLCMGEQDAAAANLSARLRDPDQRADALAEYSVYAPEPMPRPPSIIERNRRLLAARADVQSALAGAGGAVTFNVQPAER